MPSGSRKKIVIVGGGVIGLTTAIELSKNYEVRIIASKFGTETESIKATAIWHVYLVPETNTVLMWAARTLRKLIEIQATIPKAGVGLVKGVELFRKQPKRIPAWSKIPPEFKMLSEQEISKYNNCDYGRGPNVDAEIAAMCREYPVTWGYRLEAPVAHMASYLNWQMVLLSERGVSFERSTIEDLEAVSRSCDIVINCTGLGARELANDASFVPYKGQYFVLNGDVNAPLDYIGDDDFPTGMAYMIARSGEVMVGGSAEEGIEDFQPTVSWASVVRRAGIYVPWLRMQPEQDPSRRLVVGIRPARTNGVRVEKQLLQNGRTVIHNYGHGGSGFSLSWGCAESVAQLIESPTPH